MTCHGARKQLSALVDHALSVPERETLDAHLAACAECRRELAQLRGTVALLGRVPSVHAPAGFVDRVMVQAYRRSWPRRLLDGLFRPLRVKLPLEAAAVLLIGVSALYVYHHAPEVRQVARRETGEPSPAPLEAPPAAPAAGTAGERPSSPDLMSETKRAPVGPGTAGEETRPAPSAAPPPTPSARPAPTTRRGDVPGAPEGKSETMPGARPELQAKPKVGAKPEKEGPVQRRPDASGAAGTPSVTGKVAATAEPSPSRDAAGALAAPVPAPAEMAAQSAAPSTPMPEARGHVGGAASAPSAAPVPEGATGDARSTARSRTAAALMRAVDASGHLAVPAREPAEVALDALLGRLGATRVARRLEGDQGLVLIDVVVSVARYHELVEGLGRIGRWTTEHEPKTLPPEVRVEVAVTVEP